MRPTVAPRRRRRRRRAASIGACLLAEDDVEAWERYRAERVRLWERLATDLPKPAIEATTSATVSLDEVGGSIPDASGFFFPTTPYRDRSFARDHRLARRGEEVGVVE